MVHPFRASWCSAAALVLVAAGCAAVQPAAPGSAAPRPALDVPARFDGVEVDACRNPMRDPRDGTELRLRRSADGQGDYAVPPGRYGVADGELLRVDCTTGRPLGIVRA